LEILMNDQIVSLDNLEMLRALLGRVSTHLEAIDLANAEVNMSDVRYRPLTIAVAEAGNRLQGLIADFLLAQHLADQDELSPSGETHQAEADAGEEDQDEVDQAEADPTTNPDQLQLFDPSDYENPPTVQKAMKKYRLLADE
jgi:hypothetical protein